MSNVDLDRLDALFAAATPGEMTYGIRHDESAWFSIGNHRTGPHIQGDIYCDESNLAFLAAIRNNFPALAAELRTLRARVAELEADNDELRVALENHNSGSKQLAKWLEESRLEAMDAKRQAASDRARFRMMRVDLATLLEGHRIKGISSLFLDMEEYLQNAGQLDR